MLSGLSISELKEFLGADGIDATYDKAASSAQKLAEATESVRQKNVANNAALLELSRIQSTLNSAFTNISKFSTTAADARVILRASTGMESLTEGKERLPT